MKWNISFKANLKKPYSASDLRRRIGNNKSNPKSKPITPKQFKNRSEKIKLVYGIDLDRYKKDQDLSSTNYSFNIFELELLSILMKNIDCYPIKPTEYQFYDDKSRKKFLENNPENFTKYLKTIIEDTDNIQINELRGYFHSSHVYDQTLEWTSSNILLEKALSDFFVAIKDLDGLDYSNAQKDLTKVILDHTFEVIKKQSIKEESLPPIEKRMYDMQEEYQQFKIDKLAPKFTERSLVKNNDDFLDIFIVNTLNEMYSSREKIIKKIKEDKTPYNNLTDQPTHTFLEIANGDKTKADIAMMQEIENWSVADPLSLEIYQSYNSTHDENIALYYEAINHNRTYIHIKMEILQKLRDKKYYDFNLAFQIRGILEKTAELYSDLKEVMEEYYSKHENHSHILFKPEKYNYHEILMKDLFQISELLNFHYSMLFESHYNDYLTKMEEVFDEFSNTLKNEELNHRIIQAVAYNKAKDFFDNIND